MHSNQDTEVSAQILLNIHDMEAPHIIYRKISNIRRTKSQNLIDSRIVLQLSLPNPLMPVIKSRMNM